MIPCQNKLHRKFCLCVAIIIFYIIFLKNISYDDIDMSYLWMKRTDSMCRQYADAEMEESIDGIYDISLCFTADKTNTKIRVEPTIDASLVVDKSVREGTLGFKELAEIPDSAWLSNFSRDVYNLYPQTLAMDDVINQVKNGLLMLEEPINILPIRFLSVPSNVCPPKSALQSRKLDVLIIIKSAVYNVKSRAQIRRDYSDFQTVSPLKSPIENFHVGIIFSIGMPRKSGFNLFQRDGFNVSLNGRAGDALLEHSKNNSRLARDLNEEMASNKDLLIGEYEDTYFNLTLKLMHSMRWSAQFCRPFKPTIVMQDDDYRVNISMLHTFLTGVGVEERGRLLKGITQNSNAVIRPINHKNMKWALSKSEFPWPKHPPYALGIFNIIGYDLLENADIAMFFTKHIHVDDVWLAMVFQKLGFKFTSQIGSFISIAGEVPCKNVLFGPVDYFKRCNWFRQPIADM